MRRNSCWLKGIEELNGIVDDLFGIWHCVHGFIAYALSRQHVQKFVVDGVNCIVFRCQDSPFT